MHLHTKRRPKKKRRERLDARMVATHPAFFIMSMEKRVQPVEDDRSSGPLVLLVLLGIVPYVYRFRFGSFIRHRADSPEHFSRPREYVFHILI